MMDNMSNSLVYVIFGLSLSIFIALWAGLSAYRSLDRPLKLMFYYSILSATLGGFISVLSLCGRNNIFLVNLFSVFEFAFISAAYYFVFQLKGPKSLWAYSGLLAVVVSIYLYDAIVDVHEYNNGLKAVISLIMVAASLTYLIVELVRFDEERNNKAHLVLSVGVFMYYASSFLIVFAGSTNSLMSEQQVVWVYLIHSVFYFIFVLLLTFAFLLCKKPSGHLKL
jgi:hypothetical protein